MVTAYVAQRQGTNAAPASINRELAAIKRAFALAQKAGKMAERPHVEMPQENNRRKVFFEPEQFAAPLPPFCSPGRTGSIRCK